MNDSVHISWSRDLGLVEWPAQDAGQAKLLQVAADVDCWPDEMLLSVN